MNVMIIDGGGRGQALAHKLAPECDRIFVSPGNPGNKPFAYSTGIETTHVRDLLAFAKCNDIDLTIAANDDSLAAGVVDHFTENDQTIFGPTQEQARIETDKNYAKELGRSLGVPMGAYSHFTNKQAALDYATACSWPMYVKDNGLAQGKGVTRCENPEEFERIIYTMNDIVVEEFVDGPELSLHTFGDGKTSLTIPMVARDHKTRDAFDRGPMTGGMGTVAPLKNYSPAEVLELGERFAHPVIKQLGFKGILFSGLKGSKGHENNLEWNARPGDPETQVFLRLMQSDLLPVIVACVEGNLHGLSPLRWAHDMAAVCLALAAPGYPENTQKGAVIEGIEAAEKLEGVTILHAGTRRRGSDLVTAGGRVLNAVSVARNLRAATLQAYEAAELITFDGEPTIVRTDIGRTAINGQ